MVWQPRIDQWRRGYVHAQAFADRNQHLAVPLGYDSDGFKLGVWPRNQRERSQTLPAERQAQLAALDPDWNHPWPLAWQRNYQAARAFHRGHGHLRVPRTFRTAEGQHLGEWLHTQRTKRDQLSPGQVERLDVLGMTWTPTSPHEAAWQAGLDAARAYLAEHGSLQVPQKYVTRDGYRLGVWINNQRRRRDRLTPDRLRALNALGMIWNAPK